MRLTQQIASTFKGDEKVKQGSHYMRISMKDSTNINIQNK